MFQANSKCHLPGSEARNSADFSMSFGQKVYLCDNKHHTLMKHWLALLAAILLVPVCARAQQERSDPLGNTLQYVPRLTVLVLDVCNVEHRTKGRWHYLANTVGSTVAASGMAWALKRSVHEWRPDRTDRRSFPSGHAAMAFSGAHILQKEYGQHSPWISAGGYAVATAVAVSRVTHDRHHWYDVAAGAAIGILGTELVYFTTGKLFAGCETAVGLSGEGLTVNVAF